MQAPGWLALAAGWLAARPPARSLGLQRQVQRRWRGNPSAEVTYFLWGLMLGAGVLTVIPWSAFLVLVAAEAVAGPPVAVLAGATFGAGRAVAAIVQGSRETDPQRTMDLLPRLRSAARKANLAAVAVAGLAIVSVLAIKP